MNIEEERKIQIDNILAKYGMKTMEDARFICKDKLMDIDKILGEIRNDICDVARDAFTVGSAIALKKDTKLASYAAFDIGEGIQSYIVPLPEIKEEGAGYKLGFKAQAIIKDATEPKESEVDFARTLTFMNMNNSELVDATVALAKEIEKVEL